MIRTLMPLAFVLLAPVPPPSEKELIAKHWGVTKGNGEFTLGGKQLTIRSDGEPTRKSVHSIVDNTERIPHTTKTAKGDFEVTVRGVAASAPINSAQDGDPSTMRRACPVRRWRSRRSDAEPNWSSRGEARGTDHYVGWTLCHPQALG